MFFFTPVVRPEARLSYDTELTPEEQVERLYVGSRFRKPAVQNLKRAASAGLPGGVTPPLDSKEEAPYHTRVWYPVAKGAPKAKQSKYKAPKTFNDPPNAVISNLVAEKTKKELGAHKEALSKHAHNLHLVAASFFGETEACIAPHRSDPDQTEVIYKLGFLQYKTALEGLGIDDVLLIQSSFEVLRGDNSWLYYSEMVESFDVIVNGAGRETFLRESFDLFATLGGTMQYSGIAPSNGFNALDYIHVDKLIELRRLRMTDKSTRTHLMIKTLLQLAATTRKQEEENFANSMGKSKKGKKKKAVQLAPLRLRDDMKWFHRSRHVSRKTFAQQMKIEPNMIRAFLPVALRLIVDQGTAYVITRESDPKMISPALLAKRSKVA